MLKVVFNIFQRLHAKLSKQAYRNPQILLAPMNNANMPMQVATKLKELGYVIEHLQYTLGGGHKFGYALDREVDVRSHGGRIKAHGKMVEEYIEREFDIFHFWNKSLFFSVNLTCLTGFDIPLLKARNKKVIFKFTGFDSRTPTKDLACNPYSPYRYGYQNKVPEDLVLKFNNFLAEYVDEFVVEDPEMQQFCPSATIIPRALDLKEWEFIGVKPESIPLVVHAPSDPVCKGTSFILKAIEELQAEGFKFKFKFLQNMPHFEAKQWYKKADIIIDQLLIGATGVLSLEAMAMGKPVVLNLREDLFRNFYGCELPVVNANPHTIKKQLKLIIKDYEWRNHLSKAGRQLIEKHHNIDFVINDYIALYKRVFSNQPIRPATLRDIDYLVEQALLYEKAEKILTKLNHDKIVLASIKNDAEWDELAASLPDKLKSAVFKQCLGKTHA